MSPRLFPVALFAIACTASDPVDSEPDGPPPGGVETVQLETRDGVTLIADVVEGEPGAPAVVLLHMTPTGGWNRTDWPNDFLTALNDRGWWVLALDRRGAGESGGVPEDAFEGEAGRYDVEAAVLDLAGRGVGDLAVIGASNGTTSALDYATWAGGEGLPEPVALGFMTGGTYTENQTDMEAFAAFGAPAVFTFSTAERAWSVDQQALDPGSWSFLEYPDGAHGTQMFAAVPEVVDDVSSFLEGVF
jgi:pimeloyl-ACP methyl ester carboxylesterase